MATTLENPAFGLSDKVVLITGANGAIPRAAAITFIGLGCKLVLTDVNEKELISFSSSLDGGTKNVLALKHDVTLEADSVSVVRETMRRFGRLDCLVTGAGIYPEAKFSELSYEAWRKTMAVNLDGAFLISRESCKVMAAGSSIVHIASLAAYTGSLSHADYAASKGGLVSLTRAMAKDLSPSIRVNALAPGFIDTPLAAANLANPEALIAQTPLRRIGRPNDIAQAAAFLCSDWASFITGQIIHVNGGLFIG